MAKTWVPYDQMITGDECPGDNYIAIDDDGTSLSLRRDADDVVWLIVRAPTKRSAMLRIDATGIAGEAVADYLAATAPRTEGGRP
jgi:hypothetical protein